jgi:hypothetical protein
LKKFKTVLMEYSGAGGKLIHEKNQKQKISDTVPFNGLLRDFVDLSKICRSLFFYIFLS